jgi:hypothetical protein
MFEFRKNSTLSDATMVLDGSFGVAGDDFPNVAGFICNIAQLLMNVKRSALMTSAWVVHMPCG